MRNAVLIIKKELRRYFASPIGYVLIFGSLVVAGWSVYVPDPGILMRHVFALSQFLPSRELVAENPRVTLMVGLLRPTILLLIPMISMRLFVEEKRHKSIEMLLTSPIEDHEIVLGKWSAAMLMYTLILAMFVIELGIFRRPNLDWRLVWKTQSALLAQGAGLLAIGECVSTFTSHEVVAASGTFVVCWAVLKYHDHGIMNLPGFVSCGVLLTLGWVLTWRSIRAFRGMF